MHATLRVFISSTGMAALAYAIYVSNVEPAPDSASGHVFVTDIHEQSMQSLLTIHPGKNVPKEVHMIVEIPTGSQNKYEFSEDYRVVKLDRVLPSAQRYPVEYGFLPRSRAEDGDPLDIIALVTEPTAPGILITVRPIGTMNMQDGDDDDSKVVAVPVDDIRFADIQTIDDVPEAKLKEIADFFSTYKNLLSKKTSVSGWGNREEGEKLIQEGLEHFQ